MTSNQSPCAIQRRLCASDHGACRQLLIAISARAVTFKEYV